MEQRPGKKAARTSRRVRVFVMLGRKVGFIRSGLRMVLGSGPRSHVNGLVDER
jgi:hypothetical protein